MSNKKKIEDLKFEQKKLKSEIKKIRKDLPKNLLIIAFIGVILNLK